MAFLRPLRRLARTHNGWRAAPGTNPVQWPQSPPAHAGKGPSWRCPRAGSGGRFPGSSRNSLWALADRHTTGRRTTQRRVRRARHTRVSRAVRHGVCAPPGEPPLFRSGGSRPQVLVNRCTVRPLNRARTIPRGGNVVNRCQHAARDTLPRCLRRGPYDWAEPIRVAGSGSRTPGPKPTRVRDRLSGACHKPHSPATQFLYHPAINQPQPKAASGFSTRRFFVRPVRHNATRAVAIGPVGPHAEWARHDEWGGRMWVFAS